jgi:4,5-DOPA dioxygenase extradiol
MGNETLPAIFFGHGSPMNALERNRYTQTWAALGAEIPRPRAVLAISAHWYVRGTWVTADAKPRTIHDFGNFPPELHRFEYPAPGDPQLAERLRTLLAPIEVTPTERWGLDHVYPKADVPVVQLSIDGTREPAYHYQIGRTLAALRDEGVLVIGTGNVVHNLALFSPRPDAPPLPWAQRFEQGVREAVERDDAQLLIDYRRLGPDADLAVADIDHYLPLLYVMGTHREGDARTFPTAGIEASSISMLSVRVG